ncbi:hypothetical protein [Thermincola ferriacetica]
MQTNKETIKEMERLLEVYTKTIEKLEKDGLLKPSAAKTYLLHSTNFVRWCKGDFEPGAKNMKNR